MKKLVLLLLLSICLQGLYAQVALKLASVSGNKNDNIAVEFRVDRFTKIQATQYAISYDSSIMEFISISDLAIGYQNISTLDPTNGGKKGLIRTTWNNAEGETTTYPNSTLLMKLNFKLIGNPCDSNLVKIVNPSDKVFIEIIDEANNQATFTLQDGKVKINGPNCISNPGGGKDSCFTFVVGKIDVSKGMNGCVPITAKNFKLINNFQGGVSWDKTIARFTGLGPNRITGISNGTTQISSDSTRLCFLWEDVTTNGVTLADGTVLFELCFDAIGSLNAVSDIDVVNCPTAPIEVIAGGKNSNEIPFCIEKGSYKVIGAQNILNLYMRDTMGIINTEMCVPIYVNNFTCIDAFQFGIKYDKSRVTFTRVTNGNPQVIVGAPNINVINDSILIQWTDPNGMQKTLTNGTVLLNLCFTLVGPCDMSTALSFINLSTNGPIEFSGCNDPVTIRTTNANINIKCNTPMVDCFPSSIEHVSCFGLCDGKINMNVTGGSGANNLTYRWLLGNGSPLTPARTTKDIDGLCTGSYKLEITDIGVTPNIVKTCLQNTVNQPDPIIINGTVKDESVVLMDGKIDVIVSGGTPGFTYKWKRLPNTAQTETGPNIMNKRCGRYEVMVTDSKNCIAMDTFQIICYTPAPVCTIALVDTLKCVGDCNARLRADVTGGEIPFKYAWSNNETTITISNLCAGTYTVTVSDNQLRTCSTTYTIVNPTGIKITPIDSTCSDNTNNGAFNIAVSGGTTNFIFEWRIGGPAGAIFATTQNISNRGPGTYYVKVTDSKGCTANYLATILACTITPVDPKVILTIDPKAGGSGTSCAGKCDGKITATASSGTPQYKYAWSHNPSLTSNIADNLCAGNFTVTVTDAAGKTVTATIRLNDAPAINVNPRRNICASTNTSTDGSYEAVVSGGTKPYQYRWCNNETTATASSLSSGLCSLLVTDANGCTVSEEFTVCTGDEPDAECFKGSLAISPNGDGYNDNFTIKCIENYQNTLNIYNRWGRLVYSAVDYINQFAGVDADGNILNEGTYMYVLIIKEPGSNDSVHKGTVTIVRK